MTAVASKSLEQNSAVGACLPRSAALSASTSLPVCELMLMCWTASRPVSWRRRARRQGVARAVGGRQRAGHQRDALVAELGQVSDHVAGRGAVVDRGIGMGGRLVVDQHVGHAGAVQIVQRGALGHVGHRQDQAVDLMVHQALHGRRFHGGVVAGGGQHDAVAGFARAPLGALEAFGEHRVRQRGQDQADGSGAARAQAATHAVGAKARALGDAADMGQRVRMHDLGLVERARNRRRRDACLAGHFDDGKAGRRTRGHVSVFCLYAENDFILQDKYDLCVARVCAMLGATQQHEANMREHDASHENHRGFSVVFLIDASHELAGPRTRATVKGPGA